MSEEPASGMRCTISMPELSKYSRTSIAILDGLL
jgi:hypothetical protein